MAEPQKFPGESVAAVKSLQDPEGPGWFSSGFLVRPWRIRKQLRSGSNSHRTHHRPGALPDPPPRPPPSIDPLDAFRIPPRHSLDNPHGLSAAEGGGSGRVCTEGLVCLEGILKVFNLRYELIKSF